MRDACFLILLAAGLNSPKFPPFAPDFAKYGYMGSGTRIEAQPVEQDDSEKLDIPISSLSTDPEVVSNSCGARIVCPLVKAPALEIEE